MTLLQKSKKRVNSKSKGNSFENKVCRLLASNLSPLQFKRSEGSGARVGGKNSFNTELYSKLTLALFTGDVVPTNECVDGNPRFNFVVECKAYKEAERMTALFDTSNIYTWLKEAVTDAAKVNKRGILICKWNNTPSFACVEPDIIFPSQIKFITLVDGTKVCHFEELLKFPSFWMS